MCVYSHAMRRLLLLVIALPMLRNANAQHCGYDFRSVIAVRPHAAGDRTVIGGLRITLLDSNDLPMVHYDKPRHRFHRNGEPHPRHRRQGRSHVPDLFPFAQDNYILVVPNSFRTAKMKVLVQDDRYDGPLNKRRDQWPVRYRQVVVPLAAFDSHPLCGRYDEEVYPPLEGRPNFAPVDIILQPR